MKTEIINAVIRLAILIISSLVIPKLREWLTSRTENEKLNTLKEWAFTAVWAAEQLHHSAGKLDPGGTKRKEYAISAILMMADKIGYPITHEDAIAMIEAAVQEINLAKQKKEAA